MRKGCAVFILVLVALMVAMFVSCPKAQDHRLALRTLYGEVVKAKVDQTGVSKWLEASGIDLGDDKEWLVQMAGNATSGYVLDNLVLVDDYLLFSVGKLKIGSDTYVVSVGLFNHVFTPDKEMVLKIVDKYI